ncbi:MAG: hypothetical protein ACODAU_00750 [Myxococcota bacterium]
MKLRRSGACGMVLALGLAVLAPGAAAPPPARAQAAESEDPAESRAAEFRAVRGAEAEQVPGGPLLIGAYALVWALLLLFVVRLGLLQARTARDVQRLERRLQEEGGAEPPAG